MNRSSIRLVTKEASGIFAGIFLWLLAATLIFIDIPYAIDSGIIHGIILDIFFIILLFIAGLYCFNLVIRGYKKQKKYIVKDSAKE